MLILRKPLNRTWRQVVWDRAVYYGLDREALQLYDSDVADGVPEDQAAWNALYEWDILDFVIEDDAA